MSGCRRMSELSRRWTMFSNIEIAGYAQPRRWGLPMSAAGEDFAFAVGKGLAFAAGSATTGVCITDPVADAAHNDNFTDSPPRPGKPC